FGRAESGQPEMLEGGARLIASSAESDSINIPDTAMPWVATAAELLRGGWRVSDVARHLGLHRQTITTEFQRRGMPTAGEFRRQWRDRRFQELYDQGYTDREIALKTKCGQGTVLTWRMTMESDRPNTRKSLMELRKEKKPMGVGDAELRQNQLK